MGTDTLSSRLLEPEAFENRGPCSGPVEDMFCQSVLSGDSTSLAFPEFPTQRAVVDQSQQRGFPFGGGLGQQRVLLGGDAWAVEGGRADRDRASQGELPEFDGGLAAVEM